MGQGSLSRRRLLASSGAVLGTALLRAGRVDGAAEPKRAGTLNTQPFKYCLNASTIRGQKLGLAKEIEIAAQAGYVGIEPWIQTIQEYLKGGGKLSDIRKQIEDRGLTVEGAISFPRWIVDDDTVRAEAIEQIKREMDLLVQMGGKRIAAPPAGANGGNAPNLDLLKAAERYRTLLDLGDKMGVTPILELWGSSKNLHRLGECMFVVIESGHPKAGLLGDVYHIYRGGSDIGGLSKIAPDAMPVLHMNDYPTDPPRERITDADRVMPGDGVAPLPQILRDLSKKGGQTVLSLELFSQAYWKKDPLEVAKTGLAKMKAAAEKALALT